MSAARDTATREQAEADRAQSLRDAAEARLEDQAKRARARVEQAVLELEAAKAERDALVPELLGVFSVRATGRLLDLAHPSVLAIRDRAS